MIAKVRKGAGFGGVLRYLYGPGAREEHRDPHRVGGTVIGDDPRSLAQELRASAALNERVTKPVAHYPLALPQGERLSDEQWGQAAHVFLEHMGYVERGSDGFAARDAPYVVVRHGDDHAHVVASRVRNDGQVVRDSFDYQRSHQAARAVEDRFGLSRPPERGGQLAQVTRSERESAQRRQVAPERDRLRHALEDARDQSDGTREDFEAKARDGGALLRANEAKTGKMNGYSASLQGWTDQEGEQIWIPTSKVHRELRWNQLAQDLAERHHATRDSDVPSALPRGVPDSQRDEPAGQQRAGAGQQQDVDEQQPAGQQVAEPELDPRQSEATQTPPHTQQEDAPMPRLDDELAAATRKNRELEDELEKKELAEQQYVNYMRREMLEEQPAVEQQQQEEQDLVEEQEPQLVDEHQEPEEQRAAEQQELASERGDSEAEPRESQAAQAMRESREREREQGHER